MKNKQNAFANSLNTNEAHHFSWVYYYLLAGITILVAVFLFARPASAQEAPPPTAETAVVETIDQSIEGTNEGVSDQPSLSSQEVNLDETVTDQDLEANTRFYGLKRFFRPIQKVITFDKAKKVELEVKFASEDLLRAKEVIEEEPNNDAAANRALRAITNFENALEKVKESSKDIEEEKGALLVEEILDKQIKQQKVLEQIEKKVTETASEQIAAKVVEKIQQTKEVSASSVGEAVSQIETNPERLATHFDRVLDRQAGSHFKELRNLEVIKRVQEHVPEEAREALEKVEDKAIERFVNKVNELPKEEISTRFENYTRDMRGDDALHIEIFDRMKNYQENLPAEIAERIEAAKDISAQKFKQKVEEFNENFSDEAVSKRMRERMFKRFQEAEGTEKVVKLRVLEEIRQRVEFDDEEIKEEFEKEHEASIEKFKNVFVDTESQDQAERFRKLSQKMAENPDPTTFRLLQELEAEVRADPEKAKFIEQMEREAKSKFAERARTEGDKFFEKVISSNPQDIEIFKQLQEDFKDNPEQFFAPPEGFGSEFGPPPFGEEGFPPFPPEFGPEGFGPPGEFDPGFGPEFGPPPGFEFIFDKVIDKHTEGITEHLKNIEDPSQFENFQRKFQQGPPDLAKEFERRETNFGQIFQDKTRFINERALQQGPDPALEGEWKALDEERESLRIESDRLMNEAKARGDFAEVERIAQEKDEKQRLLNERSLNLEKRSFEERIKFNPFCDEKCREEESRFFENLIVEKQRMQEELFRRDFFVPEGMPEFGPEGPRGQGFPGEFREEQFGPDGQPFDRVEREKRPQLTPEEIEKNIKDIEAKRRREQFLLEQKLHGAETEEEKLRIKEEAEKKDQELLQERQVIEQFDKPQIPEFDRPDFRPDDRYFDKEPFGEEFKEDFRPGEPIDHRYRPELDQKPDFDYKPDFAPREDFPEFDKPFIPGESGDHFQPFEGEKPYFEPDYRDEQFKFIDGGPDGQMPYPTEPIRPPQDGGMRTGEPDGGYFEPGQVGPPGNYDEGFPPPIEDNNNFAPPQFDGQPMPAPQDQNFGTQPPPPRDSFEPIPFDGVKIQSTKLEAPQSKIMYLLTSFFGLDDALASVGW